MHATLADLIICLAMWLVPGVALALLWLHDARHGNGPLAGETSAEKRVSQRNEMSGVPSRPR